MWKKWIIEAQFSRLWIIHASKSITEQLMNIRSSRILYSTMWSSPIFTIKDPNTTYRCRRRRAVRRPLPRFRKQATTPTAPRRPPSWRRRRRCDHSSPTSLHSLQTEQKRLNQVKLFPLSWTLKLSVFVKYLIKTFCGKLTLFFHFNKFSISLFFFSPIFCK